MSEKSAVGLSIHVGKGGHHPGMLSLFKHKWEKSCQVEEFSSMSVFKGTLVMLISTVKGCHGGVVRTQKWWVECDPAQKKKNGRVPVGC